jgi:hypothetical protein
VALLLQFGFQAGVILNEWLPGRVYEPVKFRPAFRDGSDRITFVQMRDGYQGRLIKPTQGVVNCYDDDDYVHADVLQGSNLIKTVSTGAADGHRPPAVSASFKSWNRLQLQLADPVGRHASRTSADMLHIVINQAYHPLWRANSCEVSRGAEGSNLVLNCPYETLSEGPLSVEFHDSISARGANLSRHAWVCWLIAVTLILALLAFPAPKAANRAKPTA